MVMRIVRERSILGKCSVLENSVPFGRDRSWLSVQFVKDKWYVNVPLLRDQSFHFVRSVIVRTFRLGEISRS